MFPGKSGMKSACNVGSRRCRHDRRVLVIPLFSLMGMLSLAEVIATMNTVFVCGSVCGRRQDDRQQEHICSVQSFLLGRRRLVLWNDASTWRWQTYAVNVTAAAAGPAEPPAAFSTASIWRTPPFWRWFRKGWCPETEHLWVQLRWGKQNNNKKKKNSVKIGVRTNQLTGRLKNRDKLYWTNLLQDILAYRLIALV